MWDIKGKCLVKMKLNKAKFQFYNTIIKGKNYNDHNFQYDITPTICTTIKLKL